MSRLIVFVHPAQRADVKLFNPPLTFVYLAAPLIAAGYEPVIVDQRAHENWKARLRHFLRKRPLCVGVTSTTGCQIEGGLEAARLVKELAPAVPVVWGGHHATAVPEQTARSPAVDVVVRGEGEATLLELCRALELGRELATVAGLTYRDGEVVRSTGERPSLELDALAPLPFAWLRRQYAGVEFGGPGRSVTLQSSRGCPFECAYCTVSRVTCGRYRAFSPERTVAEMESVTRAFGTDYVQLVDDNFFVQTKRVDGIVALLAERGLALRFEGDCRVDQICRFSDDFLRRAVAGGLDYIQSGVDTGSTRMSRYLQKGFPPAMALEANLRLKRFGVTPEYSFILRIPGETVDDVNDTFDLMERLKRDNPDAVICYPLHLMPGPGSVVHARMVEAGLLTVPERLEDWSRFTFFDSIYPAIYLPEALPAFLSELTRVRADYLARYHAGPAAQDSCSSSSSSASSSSPPDP